MIFWCSVVFSASLNCMGGFSKKHKKTTNNLLKKEDKSQWGDSINKPEYSSANEEIITNYSEQGNKSKSFLDCNENENLKRRSSLRRINKLFGKNPINGMIKGVPISEQENNSSKDENHSRKALTMGFGKTKNRVQEKEALKQEIKTHKQRALSFNRKNKLSITLYDVEIPNLEAKTASDNSNKIIPGDMQNIPIESKQDIERLDGPEKMIKTQLENKVAQSNHPEEKEIAEFPLEFFKPVSISIQELNNKEACACDENPQPLLQTNFNGVSEKALSLEKSFYEDNEQKNINSGPKDGYLNSGDENDKTLSEDEVSSEMKPDELPVTNKNANAVKNQKDDTKIKPSSSGNIPENSPERSKIPRVKCQIICSASFPFFLLILLMLFALKIFLFGFFRFAFQN